MRKDICTETELSRMIWFTNVRAHGAQTEESVNSEALWW